MPDEVHAVDINNFAGSVKTVGLTIVVLSLGLFFTVWAVRLFNRLIKLRALNEEGWSGVLAAQKRRRDLIAAMENHPDLKMDGDMTQIQEELSGLEERIEKTRRYYNATTRDYNMEMDQFPAKLIVGLMGFKYAMLFKPDGEAAEVISTFEGIVESAELKKTSDWKSR